MLKEHPVLALHIHLEPVVVGEVRVHVRVAAVFVAANVPEQ